MKEQYVYAVARVKAQETFLLKKNELLQLLSLNNYEETLKFLAQKGWQTENIGTNFEKALKKEINKTRLFLEDLIKDFSIFNILLFPIDYNNLKAAIKTALCNDEIEKVFTPGGIVEQAVLAKSVSEKDFSLLPKNMQNPALKAYEIFLHTRDGQLCDILLDKALLENIKIEGENSKERLIKDYAEIFVSCMNIKIAARMAKLGKNLDTFKNAMVPTKTIDIENLAVYSLKSKQDLLNYLSTTNYSEGALELKKSFSDFERWIDNRLLELIKSQKYNCFGIGPLFAFLLAKENEIKSVRIILCGKLNHISDELIKKRLRETYV